MLALYKTFPQQYIAYVLFGLPGVLDGEFMGYTISRRAKKLRKQRLISGGGGGGGDPRLIMCTRYGPIDDMPTICSF